MDLFVDPSVYFAGPQKPTCPVHICREDGCNTPIYLNVSDTQVLEGQAGASNACPASAAENTDCRKECAAAIQQCPGLFTFTRQVKWSGRLFAWGFMTAADYRAAREAHKNARPDKRSIYRDPMNGNPVLKLVRDKSFCNYEEMDVNGDGTVASSELCFKYLQFTDNKEMCSGNVDGCFVDLYMPTVNVTGGENDSLYIDSSLDGSHQALDFFNRQVAVAARGQTMGEGVGFRLDPNHAIAAQLPDYSSTGTADNCRVVDYEVEVCGDGALGRVTVGGGQSSCHTETRQKRVCEGGDGPKEFMCRDYHNLSNKAVFIPAETDVEYQSFVDTANRGQLHDISVRDCERRFTRWVGLTSCASVNSACDQVITIAAERKCQRSTSAWASCGECEYSADNEPLAGWPRNSCYFTRECRGEPCPPDSGGHAFCVAGDTKVLMADGTEKQIIDVKIGDMVKAFDTKDPLKPLKNAKVKAQMITGEQQVIALNDLQITAIHKVVLEGGKVLEAKDVKVGDKVVKADGGIMGVTKITQNLKPITVYNLDIEGADGYVAGGLRVMDYPAPATAAAGK